MRETKTRLSLQQVLSGVGRELIGLILLKPPFMLHTRRDSHFPVHPLKLFQFRNNKNERASFHAFEWQRVCP
ncbi:MAG: hypothetical protein AUG51_06155 [Acidobacteria bacterium 13_1_20CM_3_53_8]|nr:MAG: hypothetical protein AUG51_06155 [Acidobacteria bacterium 13_1_20CM_3_53_8]